MADWCLIGEAAEALIKKIKSKEIKYSQLKKMSSDDRSALFSKFMSEADAKKTNLLFEKKMLQKDFYAGMDSWLATLKGEPSKKQAQLRKLVQKRKADNLKKIFDPKSDEAFMKELASNKVGVDITADEAKLITQLSKKLNDGQKIFDKKYIEDKLLETSGIKMTAEDKSAVNSLLAKLEKKQADGTMKKFLTSTAYSDLRKVMDEKLSPESKEAIKAEVDKLIKKRMSDDFGVSRVALEEYIGDLTIKSQGTIRDASKELTSAVSSGNLYDVPQAGAKLLGKATLELFGMMKAAKGSFDASAIGRQGRNVLFSGNVKEWGNLAVNNLKILADSLTGKGGKKGMLKVLRAQIYNEPLSRDGTYDAMKLAIGGKEEQFVSSVVGKLPLFKQSEEMFTGSLWLARNDLAKVFYEDAIKAYKKQGIDLLARENRELWKKEMESIGKRVNSLTGRGTEMLGKTGENVSVFFWSPKLIQASLNSITAHGFGVGMTKNQRKEVIKDWAKRLVFTAGSLYAAKEVFGANVETDPTSSKFGTINGIDITGGQAGYITLLSRIATGASKNSTTGIKNNNVYSQKGLVGLIGDFISNKSSPGAGLVMDIIEGHNFEGDSMKLDFSDKEEALRTAWVYAKGTMVPIPAAKLVDSSLKGNDPYKALNLALAFDLLGFSDKNFVYFPSWEKSTAKATLKFKEEKGKKAFREANIEYANAYNKAVSETIATEEYKKASNEDKMKQLKAIEREQKSLIFEKYDFDPDE